MATDLVDVHCHFFGAEFAYRELIEIAWRSCLGQYPYKSDARGFEKERKLKLPSLDKLYKYVAELFEVAFQDPADNYDYEQESYKKSGFHPTENIVTVPLMMDIFFVVDNGEQFEQEKDAMPINQEQRKRLFATARVSAANSMQFKVIADKMKQEVLKAIKKRKIQQAGAQFRLKADPKAASSRMEKVIDAFMENGKEKKESVKEALLAEAQMTDGYQKHLYRLRDLKRQSPATVRPFLAVDPRRIGIAALAREQVLNGPFDGIKIYPPLGYLPTHPNLYPIYDLCIEHDIPITAHATPGGFESFCYEILTYSREPDGQTIEVRYEKNKDGTPGQYFAHPDCWRKVLQQPKYNKLRLNLAHFGGDDHIRAYALEEAEPEDNWTPQIIALMEDFENVYADISYCPDSKATDWIENIARRHAIVKERLMFGTDFIMVMLNTELGGLTNYYNFFVGLPDKMMRDNALAFLKLDQ